MIKFQHKTNIFFLEKMIFRSTVAVKKVDFVDLYFKIMVKTDYPWRGYENNYHTIAGQ